MAHQAQENNWITTGEVARRIKERMPPGYSEQAIRNWISHLPSHYVRRTVGGQHRLDEAVVDLIIHWQDRAV